MTGALLEVRGDETLDELRERLGSFLGLDGPVPIAVMRRATEEPAFASDLITCRGTPGFLQALFDDPRTQAYAPAAAEVAVPSNRQLAGKAASALVRWGKAGFSTVDDAVLARREAACLACPHLIDPQASLQKLTSTAQPDDQMGARTGRKVCELCGCNVRRKMRLPSESCPGTAPDAPHLTRWGEPRP